MDCEAAHTSEQEMCRAYNLHKTPSPLQRQEGKGSSYLLIKGTTWKGIKRTNRLQSAPGVWKFVSHPGFTSTPSGTAFPSLSSILFLTAAARPSSLLLAGLLSFTPGTLPGPTWYVLHFVCLESGLETEET